MQPHISTSDMETVVEGTGSHPTAKAQREDVESLATDMIEQSERCLRAGFLPQALALMIQSWTIAKDVDSALADKAAWEAGWLHVRVGSPSEAAEWFSRVDRPVNLNTAFWPATRRAIVELCMHAAREQSNSVKTLAADQQSHGAVSSPPADLPCLHVSSLGHFQIWRDGVPLPSSPALKTIALFRYLLSRRNRTATKDALIEQFWPDSDPPDGAHSLHAAVSRLRNYLNPEHGSYILYEGGSYLINPDAPVSDDCSDFVRTVEDAELLAHDGDLAGARKEYTVALSRYHGDYYVEGDDSLWALAERERLTTVYLIALDHLGQLHMDAGEWDLAADCFRRLLERDAYREDAHARLMRCYLARGRRRDALKQYDRCARVLARELGLEPDIELQRLHREIVDHNADASQPASKPRRPLIH